MNKVQWDENSDGTYNVTAPFLKTVHARPAYEVVKVLKDTEAELQAALNNVKACREKFEELAAKKK